MVTKVDIFFSVVAFLAAGCFAGLITLQVLEWKYYEDKTVLYNVWPANMVPTSR